MPFTVAQLLLTTARAAQLTTALTSSGITTPLETLIAEAEARVDLDLDGLTVADALRNQIVRAFTLHHAYGLVGPVPKDIQALYDEAKALLDRVTQASDPTATDDPRGGLSGTETHIDLRS